MKSVNLLSYYFVLSLIIFKIGEGTVQYGSLIKDVYETYMAKSIIIAPVRKYLSLEKIPILNEISRELSASGISSLVMNSMHLKEGITFHRRESPLLVVIFIDEITEVYEFVKEIENIDLTYTLQLVLFTGDRDRDHCRYCRDPIGNPFNLKFNSEMLVLCCDSEYIEEWWSESENQTSKLPRGEWIEGIIQIKWYPNGSLYSRRQSIDKKDFRMTFPKGSEYIWKENDQLRGHMTELLRVLSRLMNFTISDIIEEEFFGDWEPKSSTWTGAFGNVVYGKVDIGVSSFAMTSERLDVVDFTLPIALGRHNLYFKKSIHVQISWNAWVKPFHQRIWITITFFLLITPLLLTIIKYKRKYNFFDMIFEHYLSVWSILCQKPLPVSAEGTPLRIVYIFKYIMAIVLYAAYSAAFISSLTINSSHLPFANLQEFIDDGTYKLIVTNDSYDYMMFERNNDSEMMKMMKMLKPKDSWPLSKEDALEQVCTQKVAYCSFEIVKHYEEYNSPCEIGSFKFGPIYPSGLILPLNSEYTGIINYYMQQLLYNGVISRLDDKYFGKFDTADSSPYKSVTFEEVAPILITFAAGFSIAFIIFCIEIPGIDERKLSTILQQLKYNGMLSRLDVKSSGKIDTADSSSYKSVTFEEVVPILIPLAAGFSIAFVIFCIELPPA